MEADLKRTPRAIARTVRRDERGMTLVEMLIGIVAGMTVLMAGYAMWDSASIMGTRSADRVDSVARGRTGMERITRAIRAQQCLDPASAKLLNLDPYAMQWANDSGMQFFASVAGEKPGYQPVELRRIEWKQQANFADGSVVGDIVETAWTSPQTAPPYSFNVTPRKAVLAEDVSEDGSKPIFRYFGYDIDPKDVGRPAALPYPANAATPLGVGVDTDDLPRIVLVDIRYLARPKRSKSAKSSAVPFTNRVSVRTSDPSDPTHSPLCL